MEELTAFQARKIELFVLEALMRFGARFFASEEAFEGLPFYEGAEVKVKDDVPIAVNVGKVSPAPLALLSKRIFDLARIHPTVKSEVEGEPDSYEVEEWEWVEDQIDGALTSLLDGICDGGLPIASLDPKEIALISDLLTKKKWGILEESEEAVARGAYWNLYNYLHPPMFHVRSETPGDDEESEEEDGADAEKTAAKVDDNAAEEDVESGGSTEEKTEAAESKDETGTKE